MSESIQNSCKYDSVLIASNLWKNIEPWRKELNHRSFKPNVSTICRTFGSVAGYVALYIKKRRVHIGVPGLIISILHHSTCINCINHYMVLERKRPHTSNRIAPHTLRENYRDCDSNPHSAGKKQPTREYDKALYMIQVLLWLSLKTNTDNVQEMKHLYWSTMYGPY